jgi:putative FmdB family regulatory protein
MPPLYEYGCEKCEKTFEVSQSMKDEPLKECPNCEGELRKLISRSSFQLKGSCWEKDGYSKGGQK